MAGVFDWGEIVAALPSEVAANLGGFISILKAVGIAAIVYVVYVVVMGILNFRKIKRLKMIEAKVDRIEKKLDKVLGKKKKS